MACVYIYLAFYFVLGMFSFLYVTLAHLSLRLVFMVFSGCLLLVYRKQASVVTVFVLCGFAPVVGCFVSSSVNTLEFSAFITPSSALITTQDVYSGVQ